MKVKMRVHSPVGIFETVVQEISHKDYEVSLNKLYDSTMDKVQLETDNGVVIIKNPILENSVIEIVVIEE